MKVFKFGGASVKDADAVRNVARVVENHRGSYRLLLVVSAMGKMTNKLESIWSCSVTGSAWGKGFDEVKEFHHNLLDELSVRDQQAIDLVDRLTQQLKGFLEQGPGFDKHKHYDAVVSIGELLSSTIISSYFNSIGVASTFLDARRYIITNENWREGIVDWGLTKRLIKAELPRLLGESLAVTQGFLGGTIHSGTTTLGREGSDFSAAIFASCLDADSVTIWKDVPGILTSDPKKLPNTEMFEKLSYHQAAEMTYYGATVIHPKTIRPLANKSIPLYVKSFVEPKGSGTCISSEEGEGSLQSVIFKKNQVLVLIGMEDISNMSRFHMEKIVKYFNAFEIDISFISLSALSLTISINNIEDNLIQLKHLEEEGFLVNITEGLELVTVMNPSIENPYEPNRTVLASLKMHDRHQYLVSV